MSNVGPIPLRPTTPTPAVVASTFLAISGFILLAAASASGVTAGIYATLIVGAAVPLRHSLEEDWEEGQAVVRRRPLLLALAIAMAVAGALLGVLLTE